MQSRTSPRSLIGLGIVSSQKCLLTKAAPNIPVAVTSPSLRSHYATGERHAVTPSPILLYLFSISLSINIMLIYLFAVEGNAVIDTTCAPATVVWKECRSLHTDRACQLSPL